MPNVYSKTLLPVNVTAISAQASYPAANALLQALGYPWRAQNASAHEMVIDLGALKTIRGVHIHGCNFSTCSVSHSDDGISYSAAGTLTTYPNRYARRRGLLALNVTKRYIKITFSGAPTDNLAYWWIGCIYVMGAVTAVLAPTYTYEVETLKPGIVNKLSNGLNIKAGTGLYRDIVTLEWDAVDSEVFAPALSLPDSGVCILDLQLTNYPEQIWPLFSVEEKTSESFYQPKFSKSRRSLMEAC